MADLGLSCGSVSKYPYRSAVLALRRLCGWIHTSAVATSVTGRSVAKSFDDQRY